MAIRIERVEDVPDMAGEVLGFGPDGWCVGVIDQVTIQCGNLTLQQVMDCGETQHKGLLGNGDIVRYLQSEDAVKREARGWIVFLPKEEGLE